MIAEEGVVNPSVASGMCYGTCFQFPIKLIDFRDKKWLNFEEKKFVLCLCFALILCSDERNN